MSSSSSDSDSSSVSDSSSDSSSFSGSFPLPSASFAIFDGTSSKRVAQYLCWRRELVTRVASAAGEKVLRWWGSRFFRGGGPPAQLRWRTQIGIQVCYSASGLHLSLPPSELIGFGR